MLRTLIIEDDQPISMLLAHILGHLGCAIETAHTGGAGLARLARQPFDFILLDVMLPDMQGYEAIRQIRELAPSASLYIFSGQQRSEVEARLEVMGLAGSVGLLPKPFSLDELQVLVTALAAKQRAEG